jgi:hypothetical protein
MSNGQSHRFELWARDLDNGKQEKVVPGYAIQIDTIAPRAFSISRDGKQVAFTQKDENGRPSIWVAPIDRRSSPVRLPSGGNDDSPLFLPNGDLIFRSIEAGGNFVYRMKADGSNRRKILAQPVLDLVSVSPDGRWVVFAGTTHLEDPPAGTQAVPIDGGPPVLLCPGYCEINWEIDGKFLYFCFPQLADTTYVLPVSAATGLPKLPEKGVTSLEELKTAKPVSTISGSVPSGLNASVYVYERHNTRRNLYRIALP